MSVSQEVERLNIARNSIRTKLQSLGVAESGDNLTTMATKIQVLEKPTGNKGQFVGFVEDNVIGAVDAPGGIPAGFELIPFTMTSNGETTVYEIVCAAEAQPVVPTGYSLIPFTITQNGVATIYQVLGRQVTEGQGN